MPNKLLRFTTAARGVLATAEEEAQLLNHALIGPEHLLLGLVREEKGGAARVLQNLVDKERVAALVSALPSMPTRAADARLDLSEGTKRVLENAVSEAGRLGHNSVDTEHLLMGLVILADDTVVAILKDLNVTLEQIRDRLDMYQRAAAVLPTSSLSSFTSSNWSASQGQVRTPLVDALTTNLVSVAHERAFDPVVGREAELQRILQILSSRNKNRLLLVGQPGVGKTALVHGLRDRIRGGDVPDTLRNRRVLLFDPIRLIAGTTHQGQFEERLTRTLQELRASNDIILFIDDMADAILSGLDRASTLLTLAGTAVPLIHAAATNNFEKYLKLNPSVMNAFVTLFIQELSPDNTLQALYTLRSIYQEHYDIIIDDDAIEAAAHLANPYIKSGVQPDKSIQLLDEAASAFVWRRKKQSQSEEGTGHLTRQDVLIVLSQSTGLPIDQLQ